MSHLVLVIGAPGTGKTFSARNLKNVRWINCTPTHKGPSFKVSEKIVYLAKPRYDNTLKKIVVEPMFDELCEVIDRFSKDDNCKTIIIDDFGYALFAEYEHGYMKPDYAYGKIGVKLAGEMQRVLIVAANCGKNVVFTIHPEQLDYGKTVRDKFNFDGAFEVVVEAREENGKFFFNCTELPAKAPFEMFTTLNIENDLVKVFTAIYSYYGELKPPAQAKSARKDGQLYAFAPAQKPAPAEEVF